MDHLDPGHDLEQLAGHMAGSSNARRAETDLARIGLGVGRELGNRLGRHRGIDHHHEGEADEASDRRDVAQEHEIELVVERRVDRVRRAGDEERVAVRRRPHHHFGADIVAAPWAVFDHELLAQPLREPRRDEPRENVWRASGARGGDDAHRPRRIGLRPRDPRHDRQGGSTCGQMQKLPTVGKFHVEPSLSLHITR
jgi:hypothetical protein